MRAVRNLKIEVEVDPDSDDDSGADAMLRYVQEGIARQRDEGAGDEGGTFTIGGGHTVTWRVVLEVLDDD